MNNPFAKFVKAAPESGVAPPIGPPPSLDATTPATAPGPDTAPVQAQSEPETVALEKTPVDYARLSTPRRQALELPAAYAEHRGWDTRLAAWMCTGTYIIAEEIGGFVNARPAPVALDIETAGTGAKSFHIKCATLAWDSPHGTVSVLLDVAAQRHAEMLRAVLDHASTIVMHNAAFDVPPLVHHRLMQPAHIEKIWDTIVTARMAYPDTLVSKNLESLAAREDLLGMSDSPAKIVDAFHAAGHSTLAAGFEHTTATCGVWRLGAMADTVVTLRLGPALVQRCVTWLTADNPFNHSLVPDESRAYALINREQVVNRTMLAVNARGHLIDTHYLETFVTRHEAELARATESIEQAGLDPEAGNLGAKLVTHLHELGELPADWPTTATGALKADKKAMARLADHPLVKAQQRVAELRKIRTYLQQVEEFAQVTGRVHAQCAVLGASKTGRMAYSSPALQQFPSAARGILVPDEGHAWTSIDWSSIEPVVVANCAHDHNFLVGFDTLGDDLYLPIVDGAGVDRKTAKVVLLASMYGQGRTKLGETLNTSIEEAAEIQERVFSAMPKTKEFLNTLRLTGERYGKIMTADGRLLHIGTDNAGRVQGYKATNYFTQGSALSVLHEAIFALHEQGLADAIKFAMHDELVVDSEAAHDVRRIMETPPWWLNEFAGKTVVFRTDANPLQHRWHYV